MQKIFALYLDIALSVVGLTRASVLMAALGRSGGSYPALTEGAQCSPHQTKIVDWFGPPHSFTVWHRPSLEWPLVVLLGWLLRWERAQSGEKGGRGKTTSLCSSVFKIFEEIESRNWNLKAILGTNKETNNRKKIALMLFTYAFGSLRPAAQPRSLAFVVLFVQRRNTSL